MEVLTAAVAHLQTARLSLISAGMVLQKFPLPAAYGLRLMEIVKQLSRIEEYLESDRAYEIAGQAASGKSRRRSPLERKLSQAPPENRPNMNSRPLPS